MSLLLLIENGVVPGWEAEYDAWHGGEHVPERLSVPGFRWAARYAADGPRWLTLYRIDGPWALESAAYRIQLDDPTPWSRRMRAAMTSVSRRVMEIAEEAGEGIGPLLAAALRDALPGEATKGLRARWRLLPARHGPAHPVFGSPADNGTQIVATADRPRALEGFGGACWRLLAVHTPAAQAWRPAPRLAEMEQWVARGGQPVTPPPAAPPGCG
ncbi:MAG: hypothetical protein NZM27_03875 [Acetobacteraceae bacterium]|nr:hypothetical protein [Acetobacteraceae bacterium]MCX7685202.1 hypothetical protein [Acetobacteraceae bacterium]MDW8397339.1 hypothetical protein [Acetobacteraceae bacterium]